MIDAITDDDYKKLLSGPCAQYFAGRWEYFREVIKIITQLDINSVLELGPGVLPIVKNSDVMLSPHADQFGKPDEIAGRVVVHDATVKPWPFRDQEYDLFIALQVWEHLDNKQSRAFREVKRIAKKAILSFPYLWTGGEEKPSHRAHRDIDKALIADWTLHIEPQRIIEVPRTEPGFSKGPRLIYYWDFE